MAYERQGMGYVRAPDRDTRCVGYSSGPLARCFPPEEEDDSRRMGCMQAGPPIEQCSYRSGSTTRTGTIHCCPRESVQPAQETIAAAPTAGAPAASTAVGKQPAADWASQMLYPAELIGQKATEAVEAIGSAAASVATAAAGAVDTAFAPSSETETEHAGIAAWTPLIMIASTVLGLGMFVYWVATRPRGLQARSSARLPRALPEGGRDQLPAFAGGSMAALPAASSRATRNPRRGGPQKRHFKANMWQQLEEAMALRETVSLTQLAETAAWDLDEDWRLDDELDPIWDWAIEVMDEFEDEYGVEVNYPALKGGACS